MVRVPLLLAFPGMAAIAVALAFTLGPQHSHVAGGQALGVQQGDFELAIDANVENGNGPCDPIDSEADANVGAVHRVAVCILNPPEPPSAFLARVVYDGQLNRAPEKAHVLPMLDDNPDANAGETTFSSPNLGERWDCSGLGIYPPAGDDPYTSDKNDAVLACHADLRDPDMTLVQGGPLEVITFDVIGRGDDRVEFDPATEIGGETTGTIGTCGDIPEQTIPCHGAVIHKRGEGPPATPPPGASAAVPTPPPGASAAALTPERKATVTPGGATPPAAGGAPESDEGGGFPWAVVGGALGGACLLIVVLGGLYTWSRASRRRA